MDTSRESLPASRKEWVFWAAVVVVRVWTFGVEFGLEAGELVRVRGGCLPHVILPVGEYYRNVIKTSELCRLTYLIAYVRLFPVPLYRSTFVRHSART